MQRTCCECFIKVSSCSVDYVLFVH